MSEHHRDRNVEESNSDTSEEQLRNTEASGSRSSDPVEASDKASGSAMLSERPMKRSGKRPGRKPSRIDVKAKLERSRQSARECRARKKLRYQYLEELVRNRERAIFALRDELETFKQWCIQVDEGNVSQKVLDVLNEDTSGIRGMTGQRSRSSSLGTERTSTVTSGSQGQPQLMASHKARSFDDYELMRSNYPSATSFDRTAPHISTFPSTSLPTQLHGAGVLIQGSTGNIPASMSGVPQRPATSYPGQSQFATPPYSEGMPYASQTDTYHPGYHPATTQDFTNLPSMTQSIPVTASAEDPMTTLAAITSHSSFIPSYEASTSNQPTQTEAQASVVADISWLSLLMDVDTGLSRQGAESASGTPHSTDGRRTVPTVVADYLDSDSSS